MLRGTWLHHVPYGSLGVLVFRYSWKQILDVCYESNARIWWDIWRLNPATIYTCINTNFTRIACVQSEVWYKGEIHHSSKEIVENVLYSLSVALGCVQDYSARTRVTTYRACGEDNNRFYRSQLFLWFSRYLIFLSLSNCFWTLKIYSDVLHWRWKVRGGVTVIAEILWAPLWWVLLVMDLGVIQPGVNVVPLKFLDAFPVWSRFSYLSLTPSLGQPFKIFLCLSSPGNFQKSQRLRWLHFDFNWQMHKTHIPQLVSHFTPYNFLAAASV